MQSKTTQEIGRITALALGLLLGGTTGALQATNQYRVSQVDPQAKGGMPYLLHLPAEYAANPAKYYPTLIYLHGSGERCESYSYGTTNELSKVEDAGNTPPRYVRDGHPMGFLVNGQMEYFIVISPQMRKDKSWNAADVVALLDEVSAEVRIDPDRVYLTGFSFGGGGTWIVLRETANNPNRFAAAAPVHGSSENAVLQVVAANKVAIWNFSGTSDTSIQTPESVLAGSRNLRAYLPEAELITTMYEGVGHSSANPYKTDNSVHSPNLYQWFLQKRRQAPGLAPVNDLSNRSATVASAGDANSTAGAVKSNPSDFWVSSSTNYADKWVMLDLAGVYSVNQIYLRFAASTNAAIKPSLATAYGPITSIAVSPNSTIDVPRIRIYSVNHGLRAEDTGQRIPGHKIKIKDSTVAAYNGIEYEVRTKGTDWFDVNATFAGTSTANWYVHSETVKGYRLETSVDGTNWTMVAEDLNNYEFSKQFKFAPTPVRYARLKILAANRMTLSEFKDIAKVSQLTILEALPPIDPPGAPVGLTAGSVTSGGTTLQWTAPGGAGTVAGYKVYWSTGSVRPVVQGATLLAGTLSHVVTGLLPQTAYNFWVVAYNGGGETAAGPVTATTLPPTPPTAPTGFVVGGGGAGLGANGVSLVWHDQSDNETGFRVYWNTVAVKPTSPGLLAGPSAAGIHVGGLQPETLYYFWVTAYNATGESATVTTSASTLAPPTGINAGLVSHWKFDEPDGSISYDTTGLGNGELKGNASRLEVGRLGGAGQMDGTNDWIEVPHHAEYSPGQLSISMWVRPDVVDANPRGLISKRSGTGADQRCFSIFTHTGSKIFVDIGNQRIDTGYVLTASTEWKHLVLVFDGTVATNNLRLYINGGLISTFTTTATTVPVIVSPLTIGILNPNYGFGFQGGLDEVRVYNRVVNAAEVTLLYEETAPDEGDSELSYAIWAAGALSTVPEADRDPLADPDRDGRVNLLEYALGTNPVVGGLPDEPIMAVRPQDGLNYLQLTFRRRTGGTGDAAEGYTVGDLLYQVETNATLNGASWATGTDILEQMGPAQDNGDGTETVTVRLRVAMENEIRRFLRLKVTSP
jgi:poly(3-hydroxybutyrate) depolymerase